MHTVHCIHVHCSNKSSMLFWTSVSFAWLKKWFSDWVVQKCSQKTLWHFCIFFVFFVFFVDVRLFRQARNIDCNLFTSSHQKISVLFVTQKQQVLPANFISQVVGRGSWEINTYIFAEYNAYNQQGCIQLIKSDSKGICYKTF